MKKKTDLILLHAPSVYDFRKKSIMYGPVSDLVPSTPIFEMYPIGFLTILNYLSKRNINVRIINLAYRMFHDFNFNVEQFIKKLDALLFGIDLHWLCHCQGATEIARIVKKYHPKAFVVFGGFSSSYFYKELIKFDFVDFILRGDSTEEPLFKLISLLKEKDKRNWERTFSEDLYYKKLKEIPNLVWKKDGRVFANQIQWISKNLDEVDFDYRAMFKSVLKYRDIKSVVPFFDWFRYPITTIPIVRGCSKSCANCGGSKFALSLYCERQEPAFRQPSKLIEEIKIIRKYIRSPIFLLGDLNIGGKEYVKDFFKLARSLNKDIQIFFEFFEPPDRWFFDQAAEVFSKVCYEISPDSHDELIRNKIGKNYSNEELISTLEYALSKGALRFDFYFMTGLPFQTKESILDTVKFCEGIYERINWDSRFMPFISPMAPFLDPGSRIFENPSDFGYKILYKTLAEHIEAIIQPSWKYILNYESDYLSKDDLVYSTYQAAIGLNRLKGKAGSINKSTMQKNEERINRAIEVMKEIDNLMLIEDKEKREKFLAKLKEKLYYYSLSTVCEKRELEFPLTSRYFNWLEILKFSLGKNE